MGTIETVEERQRKHVARFLSVADEIMEQAIQLEHDLNYFGDYIASEKLFEAMKHATAICHIVKNVKEKEIENA